MCSCMLVLMRKKDYPCRCADESAEALMQTYTCCQMLVYLQYPLLSIAARVHVIVQIF